MSWEWWIITGAWLFLVILYVVGMFQQRLRQRRERPRYWKDLP